MTLAQKASRVYMRDGVALSGPRAHRSHVRRLLSYRVLALLHRVGSEGRLTVSFTVPVLLVNHELQTGAALLKQLYGRVLLIPLLFQLFIALHESLLLGSELVERHLEAANLLLLDKQLLLVLLGLRLCDGQFNVLLVELTAQVSVLLVELLEFFAEVLLDLLHFSVLHVFLDLQLEQIIAQFVNLSL